MATNEKDKKTNSSTHDTIYKTKELATRTPTKTGVISCAPEAQADPAQIWHPSCCSCYKFVCSNIPAAPVYGIYIS